jgi:NADPH:quinone reductase-like Zn-dependent oxidoreductase
MAQEQMKAIHVNEYGGPDVLKLEEALRPEPREGEALVRIHYAAAIPLDWKIRNGWLQNVFPKTLPYIPGFYASGIVEAVGPGVSGVSPGDRVFGGVNGAYADYAVAAADRLIRMPVSLDFPEAASILGGADSAWKALFSEGELQAGQTVLIHAAAGGVGQFAVQLAKWKGATVIGTASGANVDFVQSLGADIVVNYQTDRFEEVAKNVDLVVDTIGGDTEKRSWPALKRGGRLVSMVQPPAQADATAYGVTATFNAKFPTADDLRQLVEMIASGTIRTAVDRVFPLAEASEALKRSEKRHGRGRILLEVRPDAN